MYATIDDILEAMDEGELIALTDDAGTGVASVTVAERAISDAEAEVNGYAGARYPVPFADPVADLVRSITVTIAVYRLDTRRRAGDPERRRKYEDAVAFLKGVARGEFSLGTPQPDATPSPTRMPDISASPSVFRRDAGW